MNTNKQHKIKKQEKKERQKRNKEINKKKDSRVMRNKLPKKLITNCPELRRLQFSKTNIFNVFWGKSYTKIFTSVNMVTPIWLIWFKFTEEVLTSNSKGDRRILTMSLAGQYVVLLLSTMLNHIVDLYKIKSEIAVIKVEVVQVWFKEVPFIIIRLQQVNS